MLAGLVGCLAALSALAAEAPIDPALGCARNPAVVGACFGVTGRIGIYNGSPSVRIRPDGTKRLLGVVPGEDEITPADLKNAIGINKAAVAEMQVCPVTKRKSGRMQLVCIESAKNIRPAKRK